MNVYSIFFVVLIFSQFPLISQTLSISKRGDGTIELNWTPNTQASHYRVECKDFLADVNWRSAHLEDQWIIGSTRWTSQFSTTNQTRFYRVVSIGMNRGGIVYSALKQQLTKSYLASLFAANNIPISPQYDTRSYIIYYDTVSPNGIPTRASSAVVLPLGATKSLPLLSYQHGTEFLTNQVASQLGGEYIMGLVFASIGYVVSMPDYLGMGMGSGLHPYVHSRSEATAALDSLRATRVLCAQLGLNLNGQLFIIGYSQGGQATMALHKEIETYHGSEFTITASAPMAGPYDMSGTMLNLMISEQPYNNPEYLAYTLFSYNSVYKLYNSPSEFLAEPYATTLPPLFDGRHSGSQIRSAMPAVPSQILKPGFFTEFKTNSLHPFRIILAANDLYNWRPVAPMRMYHCRGDTTVPYANSEVAYASFQNLGATQVQLIDPYPQGDHASGSAYCFFAAYQWFETLKQ
ncbi:MAG: alpha/beta hydrolase family protein [Verrucomicrobiia bacterium]